MMKNKKAKFPDLILKPGVIKDQVYIAIKEAILAGRLKAGVRIPSSRGLAEMMAISRNSVLSGLERLFSEGYVVTKKGSGTYVSSTLPDELIVAKTKLPLQSANASSTPLNLNPDLAAVQALWHKNQPLASSNKLFSIGVGCVDLFPQDIWGRLIGRAWRQNRNTLGQHSDPKGFQPLRKNICDYVCSVRGINCTEDQIIIVNGTQQAINLATKVLLTKGDNVWLDDPGYDAALNVFTAAGANVLPILSDQQGMNIDYGKKVAPNPKLVFTAPSHQFPLGGTLSLSRRLELLDWAANNNIWILEDDYNSEFRYTSRPIQALQGLDNNERVIYCGTFSKMMFPELRLGFLIVPKGLIEVFTLTKFYADASTAYLEQAALANFIAEGHYARHVRRVRAACYERQTVLIEAIRRYLPDKLMVQPADAGIHIVCQLQDHLTEDQVITQSRKIGLGIQPLSRYCQKPYSKPGILLGYAAHSPQQLIDGIKLLANALS